MQKSKLKSLVKEMDKQSSKGFTLIEILIVIVLLGILAVAVLSAINPLEQIKKARDSGRKSDAAELLNAYERYYTTFGCYPWDTLCAGTPLAGTVNPGFAVGGNSVALINNNELKAQFATRSTVTGLDLWVSEAVGGLVSVCVEPESKSARNGGLGPLKNITNTATAVCPATYSGGGAAAVCYICVPQ